MGSTDRLVWVDLETTGLDAASELVLEIACLVTEPDLTPVDDGYTAVIHADRWRLNRMQPTVLEMHTRSGLLEESVASTVTLEQAAAGALDYVAQHVFPGVAPCCGSSIRFDRAFLAVHMPALDAHLHYRIVDVSSVKELTRRWLPFTYSQLPAREPAHRAMPDIRASLVELRFYQRKVFLAP